MTDSITAARPAATAHGRGRLRAYARLGKLDVYDYYLGIFLALAATLFPLGAFTAGRALVLALFLVGEIAVLMAMVALDDVTGFRDGSDLANYGPDNPLRSKARKPLVAGALTVPQALRFAWTSAAAGAVLWAAAVAVAPHRPPWALVAAAALFVVSLQYSYGLKISYHGFQEVFLVALGAVLVIVPYGLLTGEYSGFLMVQAVLFGFGPLMFGVYSNTNDVAGDRAVGRPTVAALVSERGNAVFIAALSATEFLIGALASLTGTAPWWFVPLMLPATALRTRQYLTGFVRGDIMTARRTGFAVHRLSVVLMTVANLLAGWGATR
ncbi:1,4-dihydroxy-2-naphthoate octaprenyltransferase [Streptomyces misionensis]|uniref:1,4-dihydroxy-2-naphthoate octaprenyltransferase n=1 Tax=Streptomyces misionensis TaxID=67331 RepID=A0A1H4MP77_9ACTN|nr:UbiA family prenyltransferase [Streptomyces misionensis]SEB84871.1 1,4-dihydroxy-2-naphthoate octaprenyltransferase [Streptomyces misionensis]